MRKNGGSRSNLFVAGDMGKWARKRIASIFVREIEKEGG